MTESISITYRNITELTVQASSLWQFAKADGSQNVGMPFWVEYEKALVFDWMKPDTKGKWLEQLIKEERVWIRACDARQTHLLKRIQNGWMKADGRVGMRMI